MGFRYQTILLLILFVLGADSFFLFNGKTLLKAQDAGTHAVLSNYIFPLYREKDQRLQVIIFGKNAVNQGAFIYLTDTMIDVVDDNIRELAEVGAMPDSSWKPYSFTGLDTDAFTRYWENKKHARALIFTEKATYDKSSKILSSNQKVYFRSRELDIDGVGFDADQERKFIHIRSGVKMVIRADTKENVRSDSGKRELSDTEKEFEETQKMLLEQTQKNQEDDLP